MASNEKWDSVKRYKLTKMINELSSISGHGTELVTVYIPPRRPIFDVISQLRNESGTASNIKSDLTRTHVQDALSRTIEQLKLFKEPPENGLVIFCGAIPNDKGIGKEKIEIYSVIPPKPVQISLYRCDDHFWTDHLKEMMKDDKVIGILSIDTQETGIGILTGDRWEAVDSITSGVAGKHRQGGQSARRFERLRENELNDYYHRVAGHVKKVLSDALRSYRPSTDNGGAGTGEESLFDGLKRRGLIGVVKGGPPDLSTNPKHMEGFGEPRYPKNPD